MSGESIYWRPRQVPVSKLNEESEIEYENLGIRRPVALEAHLAEVAKETEDRIRARRTWER